MRNYCRLRARSGPRMRSKFVRDDVVHYGTRMEVTEMGTRVYFLCERERLLGALYGGTGHNSLPMYEPGLEVFHVFDNVDCMTCLVLEARLGGSV